jgi:hypothetical protein
MTPQPTTTADALTRGELRFAIVATFNADTEPIASSINVKGKLHYGDGSRDMTGTVRLMDGTILPFAYIDGRFAIREGDLIRWDEEGYSPAWGGYGMSWPFEDNVLLVEVQDGRVRRWTWPGVVMSDTRYHIGDHRYLELPDYDHEVRFAGLHCIIDLTSLSAEMVEEVVGKTHSDFPPAAVYVGHQADDYLAQAKRPSKVAVFVWDRAVGLSHFVCFDQAT